MTSIGDMYLMYGRTVLLRSLVLPAPIASLPSYKNVTPSAIPQAVVPLPADSCDTSISFGLLGGNDAFQAFYFAL